MIPIWKKLLPLIPDTPPPRSCPSRVWLGWHVLSFFLPNLFLSRTTQTPGKYIYFFYPLPSYQLCPDCRENTVLVPLAAILCIPALYPDFFGGVCPPEQPSERKRGCLEKIVIFYKRQKLRVRLWLPGMCCVGLGDEERCGCEANVLIRARQRRKFCREGIGGVCICSSTDFSNIGQLTWRYRQRFSR